MLSKDVIFLATNLEKNLIVSDLKSGLHTLKTLKVQLGAGEKAESLGFGLPESGGHAVLPRASFWSLCERRTTWFGLASGTTSSSLFRMLVFDALL